MPCINCTQAITEQNANDQKIINIAKDLAKKENRDVGLYRDEFGTLCIVPEGAPGFPVIHIITPQH